MTQRESKLSRRIMDEIRGMGAFCFKVWGNEHTMAGLPDVIGVYRGVFFGLETKTPDKRANVSKVQTLVHKRIRAAGGAVTIVCSPGEARRFLESLVDRDDRLSDDA